MTQDQITTFEYCKKYIESIESWKKQLPFGVQKFGCGTGQPSIEYILENKHRKMYETINKIMDDTRDEVQKIIDEI